jgi:transcriptional regulator
MEGFLQNDQVFAIFFWTSFLYFASLMVIMKLPTWNYIAVHVYGKIKVSKAGHYSILKDSGKVEGSPIIQVDDLSQKKLRNSSGLCF